jgi:hypothetical protein
VVPQWQRQRQRLVDDGAVSVANLKQITQMAIHRLNRTHEIEKISVGHFYFLLLVFAISTFLFV